MERRGVRMRCSADSTAVRTADDTRVKLLRRWPSRFAATDSTTLAGGRELGQGCAIWVSRGSNCAEYRRCAWAMGQVA